MEFYFFLIMRDRPINEGHFEILEFSNKIFSNFVINLDALAPFFIKTPGKFQKNFQEFT